MAYKWSERPVERNEIRLDDDRPVWFVSDIHLGNGSHSDIFMGKDAHLLELLDEVRRSGARLVVAGDAIDFQQSWNFTRIVEAHGRLLRALSELADTNGVYYVTGNHDDDIRVYRDILRFEVCSRLWIGEHIAVQHGHEFDPVIGPDLATSHRATRIHHWVEDRLRTFFRVPFADFYHWGNRLGIWIAYRLWQLIRLRNRALRALGAHAVADRSERGFNHWIRSDAGDPVGMTRPALAWARQHGVETVVCGHSHMPGNMLHEGVRYCNTGSWTFAWAQYLRYEGGVFAVKDWISGREYGDELYRPLLDGDLDHVNFDRWWRNQYLGWFRYRSGELRHAYGSAR